MKNIDHIITLLLTMSHFQSLFTLVLVYRLDYIRGGFNSTILVRLTCLLVLNVAIEAAQVGK